MSGHSKWSQIKHKKGIEDAKKSKAFSMMSRTLIAEAKRCGGDRNQPALKRAIDRAKEINMPADNIERAISKANGTEADNFETVTYEAYGPGGVGLIIEGLTDNKNRTTPEIKHLLGQFGLSLAPSGAVTWSYQLVDGDWQAKIFINLSEPDQKKLAEIIASLENHDDIKAVYSNQTTP